MSAIQSSIQALRQQAPSQFNSSFAARPINSIHRRAHRHHLIKASRRQAPFPSSIAPVGANPYLQLRVAGLQSISSASRRWAPSHIFSFAPLGANPYLQLSAGGRLSISSAEPNQIRASCLRAPIHIFIPRAAGHLAKSSLSRVFHASTIALSILSRVFRAGTIAVSILSRVFRAGTIAVASPIRIFCAGEAYITISSSL